MYINQTHKLPKPGRRASCDAAAFKAALAGYSDIFELFTEDPCKIDVYKDAAINFDLENISEGWNTEPSTPFTICYINVDEKRKIPFIKGYAGGDWEQPVGFIVYLSDKGKLRLYTPRRGNIFNANTKEAINNDEDADEAFAKSIGISYDDLIDPELIKFDEEGMLEDIKARLIPC